MKKFIKIALIGVLFLAVITVVMFFVKTRDYVKIYIETVDSTYNIIIEIVIPMIITFLGTFLGFILAFVGEVIINNIKSNKETKEIISALEKEISTNRTKRYDGKLYSNFYIVDSFEGICSSGKIYMILKKSWYSELIDLYNKYREVNYFFSIAIDEVRRGKSDKKIIESQKEMIDNLNKLADTLLKKIK